MPVTWPPADWHESKLYRDEETRLPTQLYPFHLERPDDQATHWLVIFDPRDGRAAPKRVGKAGDIFAAFQKMFDAYKAWFPTRPIERVYFIGDELRVGRMVKIGYSISPEARLRALQTSSPERLKIFATVPGGRALEGKYHSRWKPRRRAGEWFVLGDCIIDEIARLSVQV